MSCRPDRVCRCRRARAGCRGIFDLPPCEPGTVPNPGGMLTVLVCMIVFMSCGALAVQIIDVISHLSKGTP